ncbi:MAG: uracil-DNA glycosylase [Verrucomicrobiales bacterium]|jgi:DNA polymerase|nr:uracil-DNA glycosylase [Verrucomicrobiales bacterium]MBT6449717.1 uracil-DNA glycosylase [Verrucomicrobiales bacterium]
MAYHQLLDATVNYLEGERSHGRRHVNVNPEKLSVLFRPLPKHPAQPIAETACDSLADLRAQALACTRCEHLVASRQQVVFGVGNEAADILFVGDAPGADEDAQGEPFVDAAGGLLTKMLKAMGLAREDVYIANILKCRPDTPNQRSDNRAPTAEEMTTCSPWLHRQIDFIQPKAIVALGKMAVGGLLEMENAPITKMRGTWQTYRGIPLMPTFHPAYLLHQESMQNKRKVWEDLLAVMEKTGLSISEKQRGFFLKH